MKKTDCVAFWRDCALTTLIMSASVGVSLLLSKTSDDNNPFAAPLFILAVALVSRFTSGYFFGVFASVLGVFCVNYMFTYPFFEFDVSLVGYPLTFTVMLLVSIIICTLSTRLKLQQKLHFEAENEKIRANLLRGVSHDIRTPLASIYGASLTLLDNANIDPSDRDELLRGINADARWLI
ncbi:MAG: DUF4118 domain-containing protein, partial [Clostridia bacterium]|nr:DUF4118 domain-containing protein [Clostridia bacterium]